MNSSKRLDGVQGARGIAALLVVFSHMQNMIGAYFNRFNLGQPWFIHSSLAVLGCAGVDLFFVISGFIIAHVSWTRFEIPNTQMIFLKKRVYRVVPLYWIFTTVMVLAFILSPTSIQSGRTTSLGHIISSYLFLPWNQNGDLTPILPVGWSLSYEMLFYGIFAIFLSQKRDSALIKTGGTLVGIMTAAFLVQHFGFNDFGIRFLANSIILEFIFGLLLAFLFHKNLLPRSPYLLFAFGFLGLIFTSVYIGMPSPASRGIIWGLPAALVVAGSLVWSRDFSVPGSLVTLGDMSYSLYLTHFFVVVAIGRVWISVTPRGPAEVLGSLALILPCIVAYFVYIYLERPLQRRLVTGKS